MLDNTVMWTPMVPATTENLRGLVQMMYDKYRMMPGTITLRGYEMIVQNGRYLGDWYSPWSTTTRVSGAAPAIHKT